MRSVQKVLELDMYPISSRTSMTNLEAPMQPSFQVMAKIVMSVVQLQYLTN